MLAAVPVAILPSQKNSPHFSKIKDYVYNSNFLTGNVIFMTKHGLTITERFMTHVKKTDDPDSCWNWTGSKNDGYGTFNANGKCLRAHRYAYELWVGDIPKGLILMHSCDNPSCVRPSHLTPGTHQDNSDDKVRKGRQFKAKGDAHPNTKIADEDRPIIRHILKKKWMSASDLADKLGVSESSIYKA